VSGDGKATWLLGLSIFATGFCGLVCEFVIGAVSSYLLGNTIEQFSIIIALMMLMMGVAGVVQRFVGGSLLVEQFVLVEVLLALLGGFAPLGIYAAWGAFPNHFGLVLYAWAGALGFLIGFELPLVLRINAAYVERLRSNLAIVLSLDYVGGFVGALVWTRFLLRELPLPETALVIASLNFAVAVVAFVYFARRGELRAPVPVFAAAVLVAVALGVGLHSNRDWSDRLEQRLYDDPIVHAVTTPYQRIVITEEPTTGDLRLFLNGNLQLSSLDEAVYHEQLVHPAMALAERRDRVLVLGGGDGLALREVLRHPDVREVTLVDLDPGMTELARRHPLLRRLNGDAFADARVKTPSPAGVRADGRRPVLMEEEEEEGEEGAVPSVEVARVDVLHLDADRFLDGVPGLWDVVVVDFPDPSSVELAKLYSREFYRKLARVMAPGAVAAVQATSSWYAREAFLCIERTLASAGFDTLPYHDDVPSFGPWGFVLAARGSPGETPLAVRARRIAAFPDDTRYLTPERFQGAMAFGKGALRARHDGINTLLHPVLLDLYLHASWLSE